MTRPLNRRTVLKGLGCCLGLPLLEAMTPARAAEAAKPPLRLAFIFFPNGAIVPSWTPTGEGRDFELSPTLAPLAKVKSQITVIGGLAQDNGRAKGDGPGDHARSAASFLTGAHPVKTAGANIHCGMSVDQAAAAKIGSATRLPSLELGTERGRDAGGCDSGYACTYSNTISWKSPTTPMAKEISPRAAFDRMFGRPQDAAADRRKNAIRQSVLDLVAGQAAELNKSLGRTDRRKLDEYFESVREIEQRIAGAERHTLREPPEFAAPEGVPSDVREHIRLMYDLMAIAFQTDSTRVATFMLANEGSNRSYRNLGVSDGHHEMSHHRNDKEKMESLAKIDRFFAEEFARFLEKLKATPEGAGTLLDNSLVMYGGGLSDGNRHQHSDLPIVLAGNGGGSVKSGRYLKLPSETPLNNLFLSLLDRVGAQLPSLGDSTGRLTALDA